MMLHPRLNTERGHSDHGWLKGLHTFSVPGHDLPGHVSWGPLRVINEDRIAEGRGFALHRHQDFEIFSYVVGGELEHRDSMNNVEVLRRGDVQMTSAGTGIRHSEHAHGASSTHILQIWAFPTRTGLAPRYYTRRIGDADKADRWARVVAPVGAEGVTEAREGEGPAPVHAGVTLWATMLGTGRSLGYRFLGEVGQGKEKKGYFQLPQRSGFNAGEGRGARVCVRSAEGEVVELREGDGAYVMATAGEKLTVENVGDVVAEVLLFDME